MQAAERTQHWVVPSDVRKQWMFPLGLRKLAVDGAAAAVEARAARHASATHVHAAALATRTRETARRLVAGQGDRIS
jgi:hypothetical protein